MATRKKNPFNYPDILLTPIEMPRRTGWVSRSPVHGYRVQTDYVWDEIAKSRAERFRALFDHFGISYPAEEPFLSSMGKDHSQADGWHALAWCLAERYIDGFGEVNPSPRRGAPAKWEERRLLALWADVEVKRDTNSALKATDACKLLAQGKGAGGKWADINWKTLLNNYSEAERLVGSGQWLARPELLFTNRFAPPDPLPTSPAEVRAWIIAAYGYASMSKLPDAAG